MGSKDATIQSSKSDVVKFNTQTLSQAVSFTITTTGYVPSFSLFEVTNGFNRLRPGRTA